MPPPWLFLSLPRERDRRCSAEPASTAARSRTEVRHLDPIRIFRAAFTSRSCDSPQSLHTHDLTINPLSPRGPLSAPQVEQVTLVFLSLTSSNVLAACWLLYSKKLLSSPQPESSTHFAIRVLASFTLLTSPTMMF